MIEKKGEFGIDKAYERFNVEFERDTQRLLWNNSINHFRKGFVKGGGQTDSSKNGWKDRQYTTGKGRRNILIKTGALQRSISMISSSARKIVIGLKGITNIYGKVHNEGERIRITDKMRSYFWAQYNTTKQDYWKNLALTKKKYIDIPQREFIGKSIELEKSNENIIFKQLSKIWR